MDKRVADRRANFKKNFDDPRRKREDLQVQIRKVNREVNLAKKRLDAQPTIPVQQTATEQSYQAPCLRELLDNLPANVADLTNSDPNVQFLATQRFRKALSVEVAPPIQAVIESGAVQHFVKFLMHPSENLQLEAAWAITNIASGNEEQTTVVVELGAIPSLARLLLAQRDDIREQAVWALGNIAGDSTRCRDLVLDEGVLPLILQQLENPDSKRSMVRNATWTLSNLCRGKPPPEFNKVGAAIPILARLISSDDNEVIADACWALSYLSDGPNEQIDCVLQCISKRIVDLITHADHIIQTPALRTVGNIVTGNDFQTQVIVAWGALPNLLTLLTSPRKVTQKEVCWTISNITAGNKEQIQSVIDAGIFPSLIEILKHAEYDVKKEAAWAISNAISGGNDKQVETIVEMGCVDPLCALLNVREMRISLVALEAIEAILRVGKKQQESAGLPNNPYCILIENADGITSLERLQDAKDENVFRKAWQIIYNFFPCEENDSGMEGETGMNQMMDDTTQFGAAAPQGGFNFGS